MTSRGSHRTSANFRVLFSADSIEVVGPLLNVKDVLEDRLSSSDITFARFVYGSYLTVPCEIGDRRKFFLQIYAPKIKKAYFSVEYMEVNRKDLIDAIQKSCSNFEGINFIAFEQAALHIARLIRCFSLPGSHGILISSHKKFGRLTCTRLAAQMSNCTFIEACGEQSFKNACYSAGVSGKPTVVIIKNIEDIKTITCIIQTGYTPEMFTDNEKVDIALNVAGVKVAKIDRIHAALLKYVKNVQNNIHFVVCVDKYLESCEDIENFADTMANLSIILSKGAIMDIYEPWTAEAYKGIATKLLPSENVQTVADIMAHVHLTSTEMYKAKFPPPPRYLPAFSVKTFIWFIDEFQKLTVQLHETAEANLLARREGLGKVSEAFDTIADLQTYINQCHEKKKSLREQIDQLKEEVGREREDYVQALNRVKEDETNLQQLQKPLDELKEKMKCESKKKQPEQWIAGAPDDYVYVTGVNVPSSWLEIDHNQNDFEMAVAAVKSIDPGSFYEVRQYREPPDMVKQVLQLVALLFGEEQTWMASRQLLMRDNFFTDLEFFDRDNVGEKTLKELGKKLRPLHPEAVETVSVAASAFSSWLGAIYRYAVHTKGVRDMKADVQRMENNIEQAKAELGRKKLLAERLKNILEKSIAKHKQTVEASKKLDKQIQSLERRVDRAEALMDTMSEQQQRWKTELRNASRNVKCAIGDALISAATIAYLSHLPQNIRVHLVNDWIEKIQRGPVLIRDNYEFIEVMTEWEERRNWRSTNFSSFSDKQSFQNAIILRETGLDKSNGITLLYDPDNEAERWLRTLNHATVNVLSVDDPNLESTANEALVQGHTVLINHAERGRLPNSVRCILEDTTTKRHDKFKAFISYATPTWMSKSKEFGGKFIDLTLSIDVHYRCVLDSILAYERPQHSAQLRSLMADVDHHEGEERHIIASIEAKTKSVNGSLIDDPSLLDSLVEFQKLLDSVRHSLSETKHLQEELKAGEKPYEYVAWSTSRIFAVLNHTAYCLKLPAYYISWKEYESLISECLNQKFRGKHLFPNPGARSAELLEAITNSVIADSHLRMSQVDSRLVSLLITFDRMEHKKVISTNDLVIFSHGVKYEKLIDNSQVEWLTNEKWSMLGNLEKESSTFRGLRDSIVKDEHKWEIYFYGDHGISLIEDVPSSRFLHLSPFDKSILWRICRPEFVSIIIRKLEQITIFYFEKKKTDMGSEQSINFTRVRKWSTRNIRRSQIGPSV